MKSIVIKDRYGLDSISIENRELPVISNEEVLVKVKAVSLNQLDLMIANGAFGTGLPHVLGSDAAGIVESTGSKVTDLKTGDRVVTHFIQSLQSGAVKSSDLATRLGTAVEGVFSEYISLPASSLVKVPDSLSLEQASTLPIAALTAWEALFNAGKLLPGQTVLLQGTGGVSVFALQFAKAAGARVIITSGSDEKLQKAKYLGADVAINYRTLPEWEKAVGEATCGTGVDLAVEMDWASLNQTISAMKIGGHISVVGLLGGADARVSVFGILQKNLSIQGLQVGSKTSFEAMNQAIATAGIHPVIDRVYPVSNFREAIEHFRSGRHFGKIVLQF